MRTGSDDPRYGGASAGVVQLPGPRLGVDLGGTAIKLVVMGTGPQVLAMLERPTGDQRNVAGVLQAIGDLATAALRQTGIATKELVGAGIGLPGEVDPLSGVLLSSPILEAWRRVPVATALGERLGVAFSTANDAHCALLAEHCFGAARGVDSALLLTVGTGIGGALLVNGRLFGGLNGCAGEVGHVAVDLEGPACSCGQRGCLGVMASTTALLAYFREATGGTPDSRLDGLAVARLFGEGDPRAIEAVHRMCEALARGLRSICCVVAPRRVILAGGLMMSLADTVLGYLRRSLASIDYPSSVSAVELVAAELGSHAGAIGSSILSPVDAPKESRPSCPTTGTLPP